MDPLVGLITGGASLLGSIFSSDTSAKNSQAQIQASQQQQATQNAFTERMSSTAYQRATADMKAAGLNPAMMFGSGSAASTPSGSGIQAPMPQNTHPLGNVGEAVQRGMGAIVTAKTAEKMTDEIANLQVENKRLQAATELLGAEKGLTSARTGLTQKEAGYVSQKTETEEAETKLRRLGIPIKGVSAIEADAILDLPDSVLRRAAQLSYGVGKAGDIAGQFISSATGIKRLLPQRSTTQRSGYDSSGRSFDEFWERRSGMVR